ncbi:MAG: proton-conducting transporter membrane subunit [Kouleothrix sp.]
MAVWPFHTWLPDAYAEAPTAGSILLSAVMSKMGAYMLRIYLPRWCRGHAVRQTLIGALALVDVAAHSARYRASGDVSGDRVCPRSAYS